MKEIQWQDIRSELYREYTFSGGDKIRISKPCSLNVSDSGGHRIIDMNDESHYIPSGWIHLRFKADPPFSF
jgi:hypothetical protein